MKTARVAIPRPNVETTWDYLIPADLEERVRAGMRAFIPVGKSRTTGYITEISESPSTSRTLRPILELLDDEPLLSPLTLDLTGWAANYYLASWGDFIKAALPAGINVEEKEVIRVTEEGKKELRQLRSADLVDGDTDIARRLMDSLLERGATKIALLQKDFPHRVVARLLREKWLETVVKRTGRALDKRLKAVRAAETPHDVPEQFWSRSPKRKTAYEKLRQIRSHVLLTNVSEKLGVSSGVVDALVKAGLAEYISVAVRRDPFARLDVERAEPNHLVGEQVSVFGEINRALEGHCFKTFLLHGVTGSGKTEIYIHAAKRCLALGKRALILIPELALTPQFARRYFSIFGDDLAVLHSALSQGERIDEWNRVRRGEAGIVLGTRLSIFSPIDDLGLIVVDEEHDSSYKQDEYPIFSARDLAIVRAEKAECVCVLGSATPSLESLHNARKGKHQLLRLEKRVFDRPLPNLNLVDLGRTKDRNNLSGLPGAVHDAIAEALSRKEQILVLVGRKGHSPFVICRACGNRFECNTCSITMSYHEKINKIKCHYCGKTREMPQICSECGSTSIEALGVGTEKVDERLRLALPKAEVARMDRDVITNPRLYHDLLERLRERQIDILVGTQMIAKGHDYPHVTTVVAMGLDQILGLPDFRHSERVFQLIQQISGRSGRGEKPGEVFILTYRPGHYAVKAAAENDWSTFIARELDYRERLRYPPFGYLALLTIEDLDKKRGRTTSQKVAESLFKELEGKAYILGPSLAPYAKLKNRWRHQLIIKAASRVDLNKGLRGIRSKFRGPGALKINVDPVSVM